MFKQLGPFAFLSTMHFDEWDGGGMSCSKPMGHLVRFYIGNLQIELLWRYTRWQLVKLAHERPELWNNCMVLHKNWYDK
jgi:hypothetical protein